MYDVLGVLHYNFPSNYKFSKQTTICVCDRDRKKMIEFTLNRDQISELNKSEHFVKANTLYEIYKNTYCDDSSDDCQSSYELDDDII